MKLALRILGSLPLWLGYWVMAIPLWTIGAITIPIMARFASRTAYIRPSRAYADGRPVYSWKWDWYNYIFGNEEDGISGAVWYRYEHGDWTWYKRTVMWSAFRNPTNNMRFWTWCNPRIRPDEVRFMGEPAPEDAGIATGRYVWTYVWQGVFSGLKLVIPFRGKFYRFWIGWKLRPEDRYGVSPDDYRFPRCGFGTQFKRVYP